VAISTVQCAQASFITFSKRVGDILASIEWKIQSLHEELNRHKTCIMWLSKIKRTNILADVMAQNKTGKVKD
jgi:hypothetical protein